ncbi:MAG: tetratricopeptide repeat protein [candidate division Zixibacteria bacterium]|nr:tetratricopeptide repeat protein [candidate division Zixibacteria bacterium]
MSGNGLRVIWPAAILAAGYLIAGAVPIRAMWGFNHLYYFPHWAKFLFAVLFVLVLSPLTARMLSGVLSQLQVSYCRYPRWVRGLTAALLSGVLFIALRVHVHSLGDGYMRIFQIERGITGLHTEPLDFFLHVMLYKFLNLFGTFGAEPVFVMYSIICGMIFCGIVATVTLPAPLDGPRGLLVRTLLLTLGGSQLFFGYVESYSLFYPAGLLFVLFTVKYILSGCGLLPATLTFIIMASTHLTGALFFPAFLVIVWMNMKKTDRLFEKYIPLALVLLVLTALGISEINVRIKHAEYVGSIEALLLPLYSSGYAMLSTVHLLDVCNQILLIFPGGLLVFIAGIRQKRNSGSHPGLIPFLGLTAGLSLIYLFVIDPKLGYARDWDLFATPAAILGLSMVLYVAATGRLNAITPTRLFSIGAISVLFLGGWILTNASVSRQLARAEELLHLSDKGRGYGTELLAHYYRYDVDQPEKVIELLNGITGPAKNARVHSAIAMTELEIGRYRDALATARAGLKLDSTHADMLFCAGRALLELGHPDSALTYLMSAFAQKPDNYGYVLNLARAFSRLKQWQNALNAFKATIHAEPTRSSSYFDVGYIYFHLTQIDSANFYDSAYYYVERGLRLNPDYTEGYQMLEAIKSAASGAAGR